MPYRKYGNSRNRHKCYRRERNGYAVKYLSALTAERGYESILCFCVYYESNITQCNRSYSPCLNLFQLFKAMRRKCHYHKRQHKRVAVRKPVRHLSAVPYHIDRTDIHTYRQQCDKRTGRKLLLEVICLTAEKSRREHKRQRPTEYKRQPFHSYRVVSIGKQLSCYIYKVEIISKRIVRLGKAELAVL